MSKPRKKMEPPNRPKPVKVPRLHQILVSCSGEREQRQVYELLIARGHRCRVLTM